MESCRKPVGFDFSQAMKSLCEDLAARLPQLGHIDVSRVAVACNRVRKRVPHGVQASLTPLRFAGGQLYAQRGGRQWTIQRLFDQQNREMLYILRFYLPRFLDLPFGEKLCTVIHELWHVGPNCDGDLRRFHGRCYAHSRSERQYDAFCHALADRWLALNPPQPLVELLELDFDRLCLRHGRIVGQAVPVPKLIRVS
jgi:predicted metallopeptidase